MKKWLSILRNNFDTSSFVNPDQMEALRQVVCLQADLVERIQKQIDRVEDKQNDCHFYTPSCGVCMGTGWVWEEGYKYNWFFGAHLIPCPRRCEQ